LRHHLTADKYEIEFEAIKDSLSKSVGGGRGSEVVQDPSAIANQVTPNPHTR